MVLAAICERYLYYQIGIWVVNKIPSSNKAIPMEQNLEFTRASQRLLIVVASGTQPDKNKGAIMASEHHEIPNMWDMWRKIGDYTPYATVLPACKGDLELFAVKIPLATLLVKNQPVKMDLLESYYPRWSRMNGSTGHMCVVKRLWKYGRQEMEKFSSSSLSGQVELGLS